MTNTIKENIPFPNYLLSYISSCRTSNPWPRWSCHLYSAWRLSWVAESRLTSEYTPDLLLPSVISSTRRSDLVNGERKSAKSEGIYIGADDSNPSSDMHTEEGIWQSTKTPFPGPLCTTDRTSLPRFLVWDNNTSRGKVEKAVALHFTNQRLNIKSLNSPWVCESGASDEFLKVLLCWVSLRMPWSRSLE